MTSKSIEPRERLRLQRLERRISQFEAAAHLGCGHHRYWRIENGFQEPTDDEKRKLAKFLGSTIRDLFPSEAA